MEPKDFFAILAFIVIFKMVTSPRLRGRTTADEESVETLAAEPTKPIAPMHMPIQIPPAGLPPLADDGPEKLVIDGPIPGEDDR